MLVKTTLPGDQDTADSSSDNNTKVAKKEYYSQRSSVAINHQLKDKGVDVLLNSFVEENYIPTSAWTFPAYEMFIALLLLVVLPKNCIFLVLI